MPDTSQASAIRASVDQLLAAADPFDPATVATVFATELREILCPNTFHAGIHRLPGHQPVRKRPLRIPRPYSPASLHLTAPTIRAGESCARTNYADIGCRH